MRYWPVINNFIHDLFTGLWVSSLLTILLLERKWNLRAEAQAASLLQEIKTFFFWLGLGSLAVIAVSGALRLLYHQTEKDKVGVFKNRALVVKHIVFGVCFPLGTYIAYRYTFH